MALPGQLGRRDQATSRYLATGSHMLLTSMTFTPQNRQAQMRAASPK